MVVITSLTDGAAFDCLRDAAVPAASTADERNERSEWVLHVVSVRPPVVQVARQAWRGISVVIRV